MTPEDPQYNRFIGYHATGFIFRVILAETINQTNYTSITRSFSYISQTPLLNQTTQYVQSNFIDALQDAFARQVLSLTTDTSFYQALNISAPSLTPLLNRYGTYTSRRIRRDLGVQKEWVCNGYTFQYPVSDDAEWESGSDYGGLFIGTGAET
ncbi:uncharacterized protein LY89DRAFT_742589 [Mollisia scopiformis]|uniref:Uncharacterized protein n=1 Tax=Mollisia scopiformis TaxID=149040 RepID=A0A132B7H2_MOLSC|nr:uncharacterized protein LY89DRAFT_742589 [Mollisia scopiformis]KUJ07824.1 hypothetical protein LY89DRAFT_742589 [Mollisia scopiformis]